MEFKEVIKTPTPFKRLDRDTSGKTKPIFVYIVGTVFSVVIEGETLYFIVYKEEDGWDCVEFTSGLQALPYKWRKDKAGNRRSFKKQAIEDCIEAMNKMGLDNIKKAIKSVEQLYGIKNINTLPTKTTNKKLVQ